ncbi:Pleckstrin homology domain-containing family A member 8-like [Oopsacas minuta]|uniref:Pleckstrin homology domain-containing family A member 8 n=1 Tax=Oopsacas minuta TaxID=111878 RepID=A0AAV7K141_9METZ|nr:Pleckstrin homology domain-containing family A member 8-like [Oopsacas minuta]
MEGYLSKWTNYISGWKRRYFLLNQGVLSYYLSCEEVEAGCRGSVQVIHCRPISHPHDHCRLDIALPSKRCIYLKASTSSERQQWLVALANAKMESEDNKREKEGSNVWVDRNVDVMRLKDKRNEFDTNRQLLLRQISALKTEVEAVTKSNIDEFKRIQSLSLLISSTCDSILTTFDECLSITNIMLSESHDGSEPMGTLPLITPSDSPFLPRLPAPRAQSSRSTSATPYEVTEETFLSPPSYLHPITSFTLSNSIPDRSSTPSSCYENCVTLPDDTVSLPSPFVPPHPLVDGDTVLSPICQSIGFVVTLSEPDKIQMAPFLKTSRQFPDLLIQLFGSVCAPMKSDILGNICKIETKLENHKTLNELILAEKWRGEHKADKSATIGLLWLNRSIHFIQIYCSGLSDNNLESEKAAMDAYQVTLMPHHNWVVKSLFSFILKQTSGRSVHEIFCKNKATSADVALRQMSYISQELLKIVTIVDDLYLSNNLLN